MRVFISHSSHDEARVEAFAAALRARGIDAWLDRWQIANGDDFVARINQGLEEADAGLIVFSAAGAASPWVAAETSYLIWAAVEEGKPLIPVVLDDEAVVPPLLRPRLRRGIDELDAIVEALGEGRGGPPTVRPAAAERTERVVISLAGTPDGGSPDGGTDPKGDPAVPAARGLVDYSPGSPGTEPEKLGSAAGRGCQRSAARTG